MRRACVGIQNGSDVDGYIRLRCLYLRREYRARVSVASNEFAAGYGWVGLTILDVLAELDGVLDLFRVGQVSVFCSGVTEWAANVPNSGRGPHSGTFFEFCPENRICLVAISESSW
jgi:hypothetical protein